MPKCQARFFLQNGSYQLCVTAPNNDIYFIKYKPTKGTRRAQTDPQGESNPNPDAANLQI